MTADSDIVVQGIVLAAGRSRRAGVFKPAHLHRGKPLLLHAVEALAPWCRRVIVVGGHQFELVRDLVVSHRQVTAVYNADFDRGMFTSVQAGIRALEVPCDGCFVLPVDCPLVGAAALASLVAVFREHAGTRAVVPEFGGQGGHPVMLPCSAREEILGAGPRTTLRDVIRRIGTVRVAVTDPGVLMDLDTPADLRALAAGDSRWSAGPRPARRR